MDRFVFKLWYTKLDGLFIRRLSPKLSKYNLHDFFTVTLLTPVSSASNSKMTLNSTRILAELSSLQLSDSISINSNCKLAQISKIPQIQTVNLIKSRVERHHSNNI